MVTCLAGERNGQKTGMPQKGKTGDMLTCKGNWKKGGSTHSGDKKRANYRRKKGTLCVKKNKGDRKDDAKEKDTRQKKRKKAGTE